MSISVRRSSNTVFLNSLARPDSVCVRAMKKWPSFRISIWQSVPSASFSIFVPAAGASSPLDTGPMEDSGVGLAAGALAAGAAAALAGPAGFAAVVGLAAVLPAAFGAGAGLAAALAGFGVLAGVLLAGTKDAWMPMSLKPFAEAP